EGARPFRVDPRLGANDPRLRAVDPHLRANDPRLRRDRSPASGPDSLAPRNESGPPALDAPPPSPRSPAPGPESRAPNRKEPRGCASWSGGPPPPRSAGAPKPSFGTSSGANARATFRSPLGTSRGLASATGSAAPRSCRAGTASRLHLFELLCRRLVARLRGVFRPLCFAPRALPPRLLLLFDGAGFVRVVRQEAGAALVRLRFVDGELGGDLVLEPQLPGVGFGGVVFPEAAVGDGE